MNQPYWTHDKIVSRLRENVSGIDTKELLLSEVIHTDDLFIYDDDIFVREAYKKILNREPDKKGLTWNLELLDMGFPKSYVLFNIINSHEARKIIKHKEIINLKTLKIKYYIYSTLKPFIRLKLFRTIHKRLKTAYTLSRIKKNYG